MAWNPVPVGQQTIHHGGYRPLDAPHIGHHRARSKMGVNPLDRGRDCANRDGENHHISALDSGDRIRKGQIHKAQREGLRAMVRVLMGPSDLFCQATGATGKPHASADQAEANNGEALKKGSRSWRGSTTRPWPGPRSHRVRPTARATLLRSSMSFANVLGRRACGPSERASSGRG